VLIPGAPGLGSKLYNLSYSSLKPPLFFSFSSIFNIFLFKILSAHKIVIFGISEKITVYLKNHGVMGLTIFIIESIFGKIHG